METANLTDVNGHGGLKKYIIKALQKPGRDKRRFSLSAVTIFFEAFDLSIVSGGITLKIKRKSDIFPRAVLTQQLI